MKSFTFIFFNCPECGNTLKIPQSLKDSRGCCPFCETIIQVPGPENKEYVEESSYTLYS